MNNFTANDIKAGYLGVLKNGEKAIAMPTDRELKFVELDGLCNKYSTILCERSFSQEAFIDDYNLVALYGYPTSTRWFSTENRPLLWKHKPETEMTIAEIEEKLGIENLKIVEED